MRRKFIPILGVLIVILFGVFAFLEIKFGQYEIFPQELTMQQVQKKSPEIILTGNDKSFVIAALELPAVEAARQQESEVTITGDTIEGLVERYFPELSQWSLTVYGQTVTLTGYLKEDVQVYLQFSNVIYIRKLSSHYREEGKEKVVKTMYENMNSERYQEYRQHHVWFAYLGR